MAVFGKVSEPPRPCTQLTRALSRLNIVTRVRLKHLSSLGREEERPICGRNACRWQFMVSLS